MKFSFAIVAVAFAAALLLAGCAGAPDMPPQPPGNGTTPGPIACTADARVCPDGSYVGRTGPNCEFAACPASLGAKTCGGIGDLKCPQGYRCEIDNRDGREDAAGNCVPNATATIGELESNPEKYINKSVIAAGTLRLEGSIFGGSPKFFLDDGDSSIQVNAWAPFSVSTCPPSVKNCSPPPTISYYIGKKVLAIGTIANIGDSKKAEYMLKIDQAEIIEMPGTWEMTQALCESARGYWNECASACRGAPEGTICTLQCVPQCECGGENGYACPTGYECKDYLPKGALDAMGVCKPAAGEMTKELCESARGSYGVNAFGKGSCGCGGFAGFGCPKGYSCIISETGVADAMGGCVKTP